MFHGIHCLLTASESRLLQNKKMFEDAVEVHFEEEGATYRSLDHVVDSYSDSEPVKFLKPDRLMWNKCRIVCFFRH